MPCVIQNPRFAEKIKEPVQPENGENHPSC
jgi:hypothetical protein